MTTKESLVLQSQLLKLIKEKAKEKKRVPKTVFIAKRKGGDLTFCEKLSDVAEALGYKESYITSRSGGGIRSFKNGYYYPYPAEKALDDIRAKLEKEIV